MIKFCNLMALLRKKCVFVSQNKICRRGCSSTARFLFMFSKQKMHINILHSILNLWRAFFTKCASVSHSKYLSSEVSRSFRCDCPLQFPVRMTRICCWAWRMMFSGKSKWKRFLCNFQEWWGVVDIRCMWVQSLGDKIWIQWSCACVQPYIDVMSTLAAAQAECFCVHLMIVFAHGAVLMFLRCVCGDAR